MTKIKLAIAIAGAGVIGKRHTAAIAESDHVELIAFADPAPQAGEVARETGVPLFGKLDELIERANPEGIVVATPTQNHFASTMAALEAGIPVLVEKPIMATMEEAERVAAFSEETGVPVLVGHQRRYYGLVEKARDLVRNGALGKLVTVSGQWNMRKHANYYKPDWRKQWKAGPILTNLIHELDLLRHICGDIVSISAETSNAVLGFEKEDAAALIMRYESGALGTFVLSDQATSPWSWELALGENAAFPRTGQNATRFMGTKAALDFPNLTLWHHGGARPEWREPMTAVDCSQPIEDPYVAQIDHFAAVIRGAEKPRIDARDAAESLRATLAVYEAAKTGKRVML